MSGFSRFRWGRWRSLLGAVALVSTLAGCGDLNKLIFYRGVSTEAPIDLSYNVPVVGDRTMVGNAEPIRLGGVGLIEGLDGTGGDCTHDDYRTMLLENLRKQGERSADKMLKSPDNALVIVEATLHPGASKGDPIEVEVKLPPGSRATSLQGGFLRKCKLYNYDFAKNLRPNYNGPAGLLKGEALATAEGAVLVGGESDDPKAAKAGRIWKGGVVAREHPLMVVMNPDSQRAAITGLVCDRINALYLPGLPSAGDDKPASAIGPNLIALRVPQPYRHNIARFLRVVRLIPLMESVEPREEGKDNRSYAQRLSEDVLDPRRTVEAALRLEALGTKSVPALRSGLDHKHPLVRFACAEALAYLGHPSCAEELGRAAREPLFRAYALTALASLREAACQSQLESLLEKAKDDETRYGAFRALLILTPRNPAVMGKEVPGGFMLHKVAPEGESLVHLSTTRRAEVVLFGPAPRLKGAFSLLAGEFTVTAVAGDERCTISRTPSNGRVERKSCPMEVEDVVLCLASMGAQYPDVLEIMRQAGAAEALSCRMRLDALPRAVRLEELLASGADETLLPAGQDLGHTPTLYGGQ
jgi:flagellar basal body P-ring protein FlgI